MDRKTKGKLDGGCAYAIQAAIDALGADIKCMLVRFEVELDGKPESHTVCVHPIKRGRHRYQIVVQHFDPESSEEKEIEQTLDSVMAFAINSAGKNKDAIDQQDKVLHLNGGKNTSQ